MHTSSFLTLRLKCYVAILNLSQYDSYGYSVNQKSQLSSVYCPAVYSVCLSMCANLHALLFLLRLCDDM